MVLGVAAEARKGGAQCFSFRKASTYRNFLMDVLSIFLFIVWFLRATGGFEPALDNGNATISRVMRFWF
jgi:hypothetical protein